MCVVRPCHGGLVRGLGSRPLGTTYTLLELEKNVFVSPDRPLSSSHTGPYRNRPVLVPGRPDLIFIRHK